MSETVRPMFRLRHRVRAATGRVGDADLAVADRDDDQQAADRMLIWSP